MAKANVNLPCNTTSSLCREFSGQSATSPQRSAHSLGGLPVGGLAVGRGPQARGERGLSSTKASGLSSSKKRGDAMRRSEHYLARSNSCGFCCLAKTCNVQQQSVGLCRKRPFLLMPFLMILQTLLSMHCMRGAAWKLANTGHAYVSQHDLKGCHNVDNTMHKLFVSVSLSEGRICLSAIRHSMKKAASVPKPQSCRKSSGVRIKNK